jgi:hypothetical protein
MTAATAPVKTAAPAPVKTAAPEATIAETTAIESAAIKAAAVKPVKAAAIEPVAIKTVITGPIPQGSRTLCSNIARARQVFREQYRAMGFTHTQGVYVENC